MGALSAAPATPIMAPQYLIPTGGALAGANMPTPLGAQPVQQALASSATPQPKQANSTIPIPGQPAPMTSGQDAGGGSNGMGAALQKLLGQSNPLAPVNVTPQASMDGGGFMNWLSSMFHGGG